MFRGISGSNVHNDAYLMSFVTGGLFYKESLAVAELHQEGEPWSVTAVRALEAGAFPVRKESSAKRTLREITHRLARLTPDERDLLLRGDRDEQIALLWLGVCRAYRFIGDFARDVVSDRFAGFRTDLGYDDFDTYFARKEQWSDQLANISAMTRAKLRAVMFRLMREAGVIGAQDKIIGSILSSRLAAHLTEFAPQDLAFFPGAQPSRAAR